MEALEASRKTGKKAGIREALKAMEALEASRKDSKEDRQKRAP